MALKTTTRLVIGQSMFDNCPTRRVAAVLFLVAAVGPACARTGLDDNGGNPNARPAPVLPPPAVACADLRRLESGVLTSRRLRDVLFTADRSSVVLRVWQQSSFDLRDPSDLLLVSFPAGEVSTLAVSIRTAEWLVPGETMLVHMAEDGGKDLVVLPIDGGGPRTLVENVCAYAAAPDGSRAFAVHSCDQYEHGPLEIVDVASGARARLAEYAELEPPVGHPVSPNGQWVTFSSFVPSRAGGREWRLAVGNADGRVETITSDAFVGTAAFARNDLLVFQVEELRGHVPGTGDSSYLIAASRDIGTSGYQISADGQWLLGESANPVETYDLHGIRLDGKRDVLLASGLDTFFPTAAVQVLFTLSAHARALYVADAAHGVAVVNIDGGERKFLSPGAYFRPAPILDRVALAEWPSPNGAASHLRVVDLATKANLLDVNAAGAVWTIGFPNGNPGFVFAESPPASPTRLRYASSSQSVVLGEWSQAGFPPHSPLSDGSFDLFPTDPTGCFVVFDTDLAPGPGVRLAVLPE
jgi:hypothetical protein